jgi:RHH-type proline utilization regulon transcriptional repressor/proline dehydrogenase/delta 1-pyrroline-5-carboxylate dehydrogenase
LEGFAAIRRKNDKVCYATPAIIPNVRTTTGFQSAATMTMQFAPEPASVAIPTGAIPTGAIPTGDWATGHLPRSEDSEQAAQSVLVAQARRLRLDHRSVTAQAREWTLAARAEHRLSPFEAMFNAFSLTTAEGKALMRISEALLRIPDQATAWKLLCENLRDAPWRSPHTARLSARTVATLVRWTARIVSKHEAKLGALVAPLVGTARLVVASTADQFIVADTVTAALTRMRRVPELGLCSIDCLGESARTAAQAEAYFGAYENAIDRLGREPAAPIHSRHGISVKLSALEPRFGPRHRGTYAARLIPKVMHLARLAAIADVGFTIDAEEQDRLESTLDIMQALIDDTKTCEWQGLGLAVQTYGLRALPVIAWLSARAHQQRRRMTVRLVKGAYWDSEIKRGHERGLDLFPVFTDKCATDVNYLLAAQHLFSQRGVIFPQFATHNAMTVAAIRALAPSGAEFEFQRLHGMGEQLYRHAARATDFPRVRVYAPVGSREDLLAYLIRRLLENGANASFVRHFLDPTIPIATLLEDPIGSLMECSQRRAAPSARQRDEAGQ